MKRLGIVGGIGPESTVVYYRSLIAAGRERFSDLKATPHIAQRKNSRTLDGRTTRHAAYAVSQRMRKRIEEVFRWMKTVGGMRKLRRRCGGRVTCATTRTPAPSTRRGDSIPDSCGPK